MAMSAGDEACTAGLSKDIHDQILAKAYSSAFVDSTDWKKFCHAIALAIVDHITNHAVTSVEGESIQ